MTTNWELDQRVLRAVVGAYEPDGDLVNLDDIRPRVGDDIGDAALQGALRRLDAAGYISADGGFGGLDHVTVVTERGLRASGFWPSTDEAFQAFLNKLEELAEAEPDPEKRNRIKQIARGIASVGKDFAIEIAGAFASSGMGA